jgi:hypothetical protein
MDENHSYRDCGYRVLLNFNFLKKIIYSMFLDWLDVLILKIIFKK